MEIKLGKAYSFHQRGKREYQEDSRFPDESIVDTSQRFFIVCDGVGGCEKGEVASQTVCQTLGRSLKDFDFTNDFTNEDFRKVLDEAYDALDSKVNSSNRDMATTLTFICFHAGGCTMAHIGDSRIYQVRPTEGILYRSNDHSMVNAMVHNGALAPEQAINHPQSNVITRYMESVNSDQNRCMATVMRTVDVSSDDYFLLCTDGVLHKVSDDELQTILNSEESDQSKMQKIADMSADSEDNNTAFLIHVTEVITDPETAERTELHDEDKHNTKKIKVVSQTLEEIESIQNTSHFNFVDWLKNLFK